MSQIYVKYSDLYGLKRFKGDENGVLDIYNELKDLFMNAYEWRGLPKSVNERYLNLQLFQYGRVAFFKSDLPMVGELAKQKRISIPGEYFIGNPTSQGNLDIYGEPMKVNVIFRNGGQAGAYENHKDLVMMYHSLSRDVPQIRLWDYANKIWHAERTIDQNVNGQKTPYLLGVTKRNITTFKKLFAKIMNFEDTIYLSKDMAENAVQKTDILTPYVSDKIFELRKHWYNEALSYIGIESNMSEKSERLLRGELFVSNGKAIARRNSMLKARKLAVDEINELWDLGLEVVATNPSIMDVMQAEDSQLIEEVDPNGGEDNE